MLQKLLKNNEARILFLIMDGLGGLPGPGGLTELEAARTPHLDALARDGVCGLHQPVSPGVTPGSGPAHLALFGYDPLTYQVGRGVLSALGIGFDLRDGDVAARGNFCTIDEQGRVTDRRAGRIPTEKGEELCRELSRIEVPGVQLFVRPVKEYRFLLVLRGTGLSADIEDTDPQRTGVSPRDPQAQDRASRDTAGLVAQFLDRAREVLGDHHPANMVLLRGFSQRPDWPLFPERFGLDAAAVAAYPMYRGVASLVGMKVLSCGATFDQELETLEEQWTHHDYFFLHFKKTDSAGEDGDFERKVAEIESVDQRLPRMLALNPDVVVVTGDHSTPAALKAHSWHPVPVLLWSRYCRPDKVHAFGERGCMAGGLGPRMPTTHLMPLALANALKLEKFGA